MVIDYKKFIEEQFTILNREGKIVPFHFYPIQKKYYKLLIADYGSELKGVREIILKARQEGKSSFILALFTVDFLMIPNSISICISHRKDATLLLFRRVKHFIESYCDKNNFDKTKLLLTDNKAEIENRSNGAYFYIGTAGAKVGGRGGSSVKNLHFSEAAFYQNSEKITAREIIEATSQQVAQGNGMIFIESTGNCYGNYYQHMWEKSKRGETIYKPRFFSWEEFYDQVWIEKKKLEFEREEEFRREYPRTEIEAFLASGTPFFDQKALLKLLQANIKPIKEGRLAQDGQFI